MERIDARRVGSEAGLPRDLRNKLAEGWEASPRDEVDPLYVERPLFNQLQREVELAVRKALEGMAIEEKRQFKHWELQEKPAVLYRTPAVPTPIWQPEHPRAESFRGLFHRKGRGSLAVFSVEFPTVVAQLENGEILAATRSFCEELADRVVSVREEKPSAKSQPFMAVNDLTGVGYLAMEAEQFPSTRPGRVLMGRMAKECFTEGWLGHQRALAQGGDRSFLT